MSGLKGEEGGVLADLKVEQAMQRGSADVVSNVFDEWSYMLKTVRKNEEATFVIRRNG